MTEPHPRAESSAAIHDDIVRTRERLRSTMEELQTRLAPAQIPERARDTVREKAAARLRQVADAAGDSAGRAAEAAQSTAASAVSGAREHPGAAAAAAVVSGAALVAGRCASRRRRRSSVTIIEPRAERAGLATPKARGGLWRWARANPLALGAAIAAVGLVVGVSSGPDGHGTPRRDRHVT
ncbi:MAG: DUF3618 domain-containing protein [Vicinamibacterales bacterium]